MTWLIVGLILGVPSGYYVHRRWGSVIEGLLAKLRA